LFVSAKCENPSRLPHGLLLSRISFQLRNINYIFRPRLWSFYYRTKIRLDHCCYFSFSWIGRSVIPCQEYRTNNVSGKFFSRKQVRSMRKDQNWEYITWTDRYWRISNLPQSETITHYWYDPKSITDQPNHRLLHHPELIKSLNLWMMNRT